MILETLWKWSHSVVSDSLRPRGLWPTRLLCPWDSPGKNTGVCYHFLLQITSEKTLFSNNLMVTGFGDWDLNISIWADSIPEQGSSSEPPLRFHTWWVLSSLIGWTVSAPFLINLMRNQKEMATRRRELFVLKSWRWASLLFFVFSFSFHICCSD